MCYYIGRLDFTKISILPKLVHRFNAIPIKIPARFFVNIDKPIQKVGKSGKRNRIAKIILRAKNKNRELQLLILRFAVNLQ